jgi:hypothetical protein
MRPAVVSSGDGGDSMGIQGWRARRSHVSRHDRSGRGSSEACRAGKGTVIGGDEAHASIRYKARAVSNQMDLCRW